MPNTVIEVYVKQLHAGTRYGEARGVYELENIKVLVDIEGDVQQNENGEAVLTESQLENLVRRLKNITTNVLDEVIKKDDSPTPSDY
jgi:hypothetical protein